MNQYAEHNPRCYECENCEEYPGSRLASCMTARDAVQECTGVVAAEVKFDPDQDACDCPDFDPSAEFFERVREESSSLTEIYGLTMPSGITRSVA